MSSDPPLPVAGGSVGVAERLFGGRTEVPASPVDLLQGLDKAKQQLGDVARRCTAWSGSASHESLREVHDELRQIAMALDQASGTLPRPDESLRVVLLGRTQAGKSTLFTYLTGSDASPVGHGAQRTTRTVVAEPMAGGPDIVIVDTPGVGALDGDVDRAIALGAARHADLAVWVATSNSQPTETAVALAQVARWGVPMLLVFNCREELTSDEAIEQFLEFPESTFADLEGHHTRLARFLDPHGQRPLDVLAVHAGAALLGAQDSPPNPDLLRVSGVDALAAAIVTEADRHRDARRATTVIDTSRRALVEAAERLSVLADTLDLLTDTLQKELDDFSGRAGRLVDDTDLEVKGQIQALLTRFDDWADRNYQLDDRDLHATWDDAVRRLRDEADQLLRATERRLQRRVGQVAGEVSAAWSKRLDANLRKANRIDAPGLAPLWAVGAGRAALVAAGTYLGGIIGTALGNVPGALVGSAVGGLIADRAGSLLLVRRHQLARRRTALHDSVRSAIAEERREIERSWASSRGSVGTALAVNAAERTEAIHSTMDLSLHTRSVAEAASAAVASADHCLLTTLLRLTGRERLADQVTSVHRRPGFACLVPLSDGASLREFLRWPPEGMLENVRPVPDWDGATAFARVANALDAGRRHAVLVPDGHGIQADIRGRLSPELLAAEADLVSTFLDVPLRLSSMIDDEKAAA